MYEISIDFNAKSFKLKEFERFELGSNTVFALVAKLTEGEWKLKVASAPANNKDIPYTRVTDQNLSERLIFQALPWLLIGIDGARVKSYKWEEISFYRQAVEDLEKIYDDMLLASLKVK